MGWSVAPDATGRYRFRRGSPADGSRPLDNDAPEVRFNHDGVERTSRLGIQYLYVNGMPVIDARFTVHDHGTGQKIREGAIRPEMVTWITLPAHNKRVTVKLHDDPFIKSYLKSPVPNPEKRKADARPGWFDRMTRALIDAGDWTVEMLKGDFNQDPTLGQIITNTLITMIPVVDQVADIRDIVAGVKFLAWDRKYSDYMVWIGICFTIIGLFPTAGSLAKGVLKCVFKSLPIARIAKVFNGLAEGNVVRYLKMLGDGGLDTLHRQTLELFNKLVAAVRGKLNRIKALVPDRLKDAHASLNRFIDGLDQAKRHAPDMIARFFDDLWQKLENILGGPRLDNAMSGPTNSTLIRKQARADAPKLEIIRGTGRKSDNSVGIKNKPPEIPISDKLKEIADEYPHYDLTSPKTYEDLGGTASSTDVATKNEWKRIYNSIKNEGIRDPDILYIRINDKNYILWGSSRLEAAKLTKQTNQLRFHEISLPFRGYESTEDVIQSASQARTHNNRRIRYRR